MRLHSTFTLSCGWSGENYLSMEKAVWLEDMADWSNFRICRQQELNSTDTSYAKLNRPVMQRVS